MLSGLILVGVAVAALWWAREPVGPGPRRPYP